MKRALVLAALVVCLPGCPAGNTPLALVQPSPVSVGLRPLGLSAAGGNIYCACEGGGAVEVVAVDTRRVTKHLALSGGTPGVIRTFLDRRQVLVQDTDNGILSVIDAGTAANNPGTQPVTPPPVATQVLHTLTVGKGAGRLALGDDNSTVLSSAGNDDKLVLFGFQDERTLAPRRTEFKIGAPSADGRARPIDFKGGKILTADMATREIKTLQTGSGELKTLATVGEVGPLAFGLVNGKPALALAADLSKDSLSIIDLATGEQTTLTDLGKGLRDMIIDPEAGRAYLAMHDSNELTAIDYVGKTLVSRLTVGAKPTSVTLAEPVPHELWVAGESDALTIVDGTGPQPVTKNTLSVGHGDHRMTFWGTQGFVSNQQDGTLSIFNRVAFN